MSDVDWSYFSVASDHDGTMELDHNEEGCRWWVEFDSTEISISELMKLAEEHLQACPVWTGVPSE